MYSFNFSIFYIYHKKKQITQYLVIDEIQVYQQIKDIFFVERILDQTIDPRAFNITLTEPIGPSLKELFLLCGKQFSVKTVMMIGLKLVFVFYKLTLFRN